MANKKISIIIPFYNEEENIEKLLKSLENLKGEAEIILIDGGSTDNSIQLIGKKYRIEKSPKKGRGAQMNYGASIANGDIFFFLHADSQLEANALEKIEEKIKEGYKIGCFQIVFDSPVFLMKICGFMSNLRVKLRNIAFGDQGIFIRKDYFEYLGGYKDIPLMEDYQLSIDAKNDGEKIGQVKSKLITSERRFVENGRLKTMARMQRLQALYRKGHDINQIKNMYK